MQAINLNVTPGNTQQVQCVGTGIWFESGASTTADAYIIVKPDQGAEMVLKPGQHFQDASMGTGTWRVTGHDPAATITGRVIIGNGDFGDSNVNNIFKLDGTFTNSVNVNNTTAAPAVVSLHSSDITLPVSIAGNVNTSQGAMAYNSSFSTSASTATAVNVLAAAANVNGANLNQTLVSGTASTGAGAIAFVAKATAPTSITDGDLLDIVTIGGGSTINNFQNQSPIKVPAGKGIWVISAGTSDAGFYKGALVQVL
jgi:hypothetical protein